METAHGISSALKPQVLGRRNSWTLGPPRASPSSGKIARSAAEKDDVHHEGHRALPSRVLVCQAVYGFSKYTLSKHRELELRNQQRTLLFIMSALTSDLLVCAPRTPSCPKSRCPCLSESLPYLLPQNRCSCLY